MIPPAPSPPTTTIIIRRDDKSTSFDDIISRLSPLPPIAAAHVARSAASRKRVSFADDDMPCRSLSSTCRSPAAKRRRCCSVWTDEQQTTTAVRCVESLSMPLQPINCSFDANESCAMTSSLSADIHHERTLTSALPADPRLWTRSDVHTWLLHQTSVDCQQQQQQQPSIDVDVDRFRMNGKALCLMTSEMFAYRVPRGGHLLYKDFQTRLCRAVALSLHRNLTSPGCH